jgi:hypothetical protein
VSRNGAGMCQRSEVSWLLGTIAVAGIAGPALLMLGTLNGMGHSVQAPPSARKS